MESESQDSNLFFPPPKFSDLSTFAFYVGASVCQNKELSKPKVTVTEII